MAKTDDNKSSKTRMRSFLEAVKECKEIKEMFGTLINNYNDDSLVENTLQRFTNIIDFYQWQPQLIDPHLESLMNQIMSIIKNPSTPKKLFHIVFKCLYLITKMRGAKYMTRLFPHEVSDVEPVITLLTEQDPKDSKTWETRYELLLWLSVVCMIPFDMVRLDSNVTTPEGQKKKPTMDRILDLAKLYLTVNDKSRDAAAYQVSRFLTRPDVQREKLPQFLDWSLNILHTADIETLIGVDNASGILRVLSLLFKHGNRENLVQYVPTVMKEIEELKKKGEINNAVFRKSVIKVIQRLGLTLLKQRVASWRYSRGNRSLADNMASSLDKNNSQQIVTMVTGDEDEEYDIPDEIEDILGYLLHGLRDKDTIVRWSAAKGIGRITGRLPKELANEVVGSVLELFTMQETDAAWHGGCLSLAELGRRGLLLPQRLPEVVPVILQSLAYDKKKGSFSVGAHVRDAACYVCWAFARAYNPEELSSYVNDVACALVITSIFDREVNVRRAAAAAFQENVGRQGAFPHGIDIVTEADYFKVGNRENCYLELSVFVAQFPEYTQPMIDHLVDVKINHWDSEIKDLSAKGLHNLTRCSPDYMAKEVMPKLLPMTTGEDLYMRYGAIIAMAEITHMLAEISTNEGKTITDVLHKDIIDGMKNITFKLREAKYFKGVGGDVMRKAAICLIKKLSLSKLPFHEDPVIDLWQDIIDECLSVKDAEDDIQTAAVSAIPAFFTAYYKTDDGCADTKRQETVIKKCFSQLNSSDQTTRMGFSLALGALPSFMIKGRLHSILQTLIKATEITRKEAAWAKSRRDALRAINGICKTVGLDPEGSPADVICKNNLLDIYDALFIALTDYTSDSKGDVGAWVREASMTCLHDLTIMVVNKDPSILSYQIYEKIFCSLVQQACEKMDRIRIHAGLILSQLLYHKPQLPHIPHRDELEKTFPKEEMIDFNWSASYHTFPCFAKLLGCESYTYYILLGFTVSVGGLTESVVKYSSSSIQSYLREIQSDKEKLKKFTDVLAQIFTNYLKNNRVSLSLLKMLDQLLYNGCFDVLVNDDTNTFPMEIYEFTKKEIAGSADPNKIIAGGEVYCGLLQFSEDIRSKSLTQLMILVCSKFPKVRKVTANRLYEALITYEELVPEEVSSDITTLLSETVWDKKIDEIRPIRNKLCDLLGLARPVTKIKAKQGELKMDTKDS